MTAQLYHPAAADDSNCARGTVRVCVCVCTREPKRVRMKRGWEKSKGPVYARGLIEVAGWED